jgi:alpha-galactosidase
MPGGVWSPRNIEVEKEIPARIIWRFRKQKLEIAPAQLGSLNGKVLMAPEDSLVSPPTLTAKSTEGFNLSGKLDNPAWKAAPVAHLERGWDGREHLDLRTDIRILWEPEYIYAGFRCPYRELYIDSTAPLSHYRWELWNLDMVELHLSDATFGISRYVELQAAPTGHWMDLEVIFFQNKPYFDWIWRSGYQVQSYIMEDVWTVEMKIPVRAIAGKPLEAGTVWSVNAYRTDGKGEKRRYLAFSPTFTEKPNFHIPARFGRMIFLH